MKLLLSIVLFFATQSIALAQNWNVFVQSDRGKQVMQDNEFERNAEGKEEAIYCNPLLLNGSALDYGDFTIKSSGELTLIKGEPEASSSDKIPFTVNLRRNGQTVSIENMAYKNKTLLKIEISEVLAFAEVGDQLIINPTRKKDWKAKRILKLIL